MSANESNTSATSDAPKCPVAHGKVSFDPYDPELSEPGIWDVYEDIRGHGPVVRSEERGGFWVFTGFQDVKTALRTPATYSSAGGHRLPTDGTHRSIPIDTDPPLHTNYRTLMGLALNPDRIRDMHPFLREMVKRIVGDFYAEGGGDAVKSIALAVPLDVLTELVGFSTDTVRRFRELTEEMWSKVPYLDFTEARGAIFDLMAEEVERHRIEEHDDFVNDLLTAQVGDRPITDEERVRILGTLAVAGHESTMNTLSMLLWLLAAHPEMQDQMRQDPESALIYLEETLRYRTPVQNIARRVTCPVDVGGQSLSEGDSVLFSYAAANRDPDVFSRPDEFVPGRPERGHLAFGWGIHQCMGAALVRAEIPFLLQELCKYPPFRLAGEPEWSNLQGGTHLGLASLPLRFETEGEAA